MTRVVLSDDIYFEFAGGYVSPAAINWAEWDAKHPKQLNLSVYGREKTILLSEEESLYLLSYLALHIWVDPNEEELESEEEEEDAV